MARSFSILVIAMLLATKSMSSTAATLDTVNWAADSSIDGTGTGVLGGTNTITYTTAIGFNAGESFPDAWASNLSTAVATGGSVTFQTNAVFGGTVRRQLKPSHSVPPS